MTKKSNSKGGDLTSRTFKGSEAGAATEKRRTVKYNEGGGVPMFNEQQATVKTKGTVGPRDVRGPGKQFAGGGRNPTAFKPAVPNPGGITGNPTPVSGKQRRDYNKGGGR